MVIFEGAPVDLTCSTAGGSSNFTWFMNGTFLRTATIPGLSYISISAPIINSVAIEIQEIPTSFVTFHCEVDINKGRPLDHFRHLTSNTAIIKSNSYMNYYEKLK